ncbi:transketolase C-terminal domain-containing protein [Microlunatus parietis]|uniref:2-oxoisovalerate dehydrogenase E1 component n=1 Tax=Microlunatus parietis TaxID=682979 RepID=A0A7Y9IBU6_9ACTN|nr:transketolase C-terminal domain-containing protein [Microlunatus parietis]NYE73763.1 2-oxoisovalerate dehydrogenase E1 component [Microlunatus parietis]
MDLERLFTAQTTSRQLDLVARELQARGLAYYTIGSAGHESNAMIALATRVGDPALLHYRSGGFYCARAGLRPGSAPVRDVLQGLMCLADEPIAGGRHKVFGHPELAIIPQTSTIASHLPRAVGLAIALQRADRLGVDHEWPDGAIVVCSFGDASANHSTAAGAINTAINTAYRGLPVPILFVCEDNGLGISVRTPAGWIEHAYGSRPGLDYLAADGADPVAAWPVIMDAVRRGRDHRRPVFLHLRTVRYLAHAGSDAEIGYRKPSEIEAAYDLDPLLGTARALIGAGATADQVLATYDRIGAEVRAEADRLAGSRPLTSAAEIIEPLAPRTPDRVAELAARWSQHRSDRPMTLAESINTTLSVIMEADRRVIAFGEDVGVKGGVYGVTRGLARRFGAARVFDTILDEQSILGLALGAGLAGLVPIPEIQYLAYLHNAEDQLRGEAATLSFFSRGRWRNPLVIRIAGLAYQKGFGGHFHNDDAVAVLRDIPGIVVACPSRADDAPALLRTCVAAAATDGTVAVFLEPIALYHTRDLHADGDGGWLGVDHGEPASIGRARTVRTGTDLTMITFGNGVPMSLRAAESLAAQGIEAAVLDLRWLAPLPVPDLLAAARDTGRVLVVDETRHSGGVGEGVITVLVEGGFTGSLARVSSTDSFVPLGAAARHVLLDTDEIIKAATDLAGKERS